MVGEVGDRTEAPERAGLANWPGDLDLHTIVRKPTGGLADITQRRPRAGGPRIEQTMTALPTTWIPAFAAMTLACPPHDSSRRGRR